MLSIRSKYFYGNKVSDYGLEKGYVDYGTLAKSFQCVLNNDIIAKTEGVIGYWEQISGWGGNDDYINDNGDYSDYVPEVFQWYIVDDNGATILQKVGEIVYYNEELDMYVWGVTHYGTIWDYVLTDIKIELDNKEE